MAIKTIAEFNALYSELQNSLPKVNEHNQAYNELKDDLNELIKKRDESTSKETKKYKALEKFIAEKQAKLNRIKAESELSIKTQQEKYNENFDAFKKRVIESYPSSSDDFKTFINEKFLEYFNIQKDEIEVEVAKHIDFTEQNAENFKSQTTNTQKPFPILLDGKRRLIRKDDTIGTTEDDDFVVIAFITVKIAGAKTINFTPGFKARQGMRTSFGSNMK